MVHEINFMLEREVKFNKFMELLMQRLDAKRLIMRHLKDAKKAIKVDFPHQIEVIHDVDKGVKTAKAAVGHLNHCVNEIKDLDRFAFVDEDDELILLGKLEDYARNHLIKVEQYINDSNIKDKQTLVTKIHKFRADMAQVMASEGDETYKDLKKMFTEYLELINDVEKGKDSLMEKLRLLVKTEGTNYVRYYQTKQTLKSRLKGLKKEESSAKTLHDEIKTLEKETKAGFKDKKHADLHIKKIEKLMTKMISMLTKLKNGMSKEERGFYRGIRRINIFEFMVVRYAYELIKRDKDYVTKVFMPEAEAEKVDKEVKKLLHHLDKILRTYMQAILIEEREAKEEGDKAKELRKIKRNLILRNK